MPTRPRTLSPLILALTVFVAGCSPEAELVLDKAEVRTEEIVGNWADKNGAELSIKEDRVVLTKFPRRLHDMPAKSFSGETEFEIANWGGNNGVALLVYIPPDNLVVPFYFVRVGDQLELRYYSEYDILHFKKK